MDNPQHIAIFDLDGTVTRRDTLLPYLQGWINQSAAAPLRTLGLPLDLMRFLLHQNRGTLKSDLIQRLMGGTLRDDVAQWTREFVQGIGQHQIRPGALAAIERHRRAGDWLVLLSASVDLYVPELGQRLGFGEVHCTGVAWDGDRLDGRLITPNHRGEHKAVVVRALRARHPQAKFSAYGNAASDLPHLRLVESPLLVNANAAARRQAAALGIAQADW